MSRWDVFVRFIRDVGFPIFVAVYLLVRVDPVLSELKVIFAGFTESNRVLLAQQTELLREIRSVCGKQGCKQMAGRGRRMMFHGAFSSKADAKRKKGRGRGRFIRRVRVRGSTRYVVMSKRGR